MAWSRFQCELHRFNLAHDAGIRFAFAPIARNLFVLTSKKQDVQCLTESAAASFDEEKQRPRVAMQDATITPACGCGWHQHEHHVWPLQAKKSGPTLPAKLNRGIIQGRMFVTKNECRNYYSGVDAMNVVMKNPRTGELREVKVGWSWVLFLFSGFLGIPLFLRNLQVWGGIFLALFIVIVFTPALIHDRDTASEIETLMQLISLGLAIWMGNKGNEMTAKNYLDQGWEFLNPDDEITKMAKAKWGISL